MKAEIKIYLLTNVNISMVENSIVITQAATWLKPTTRRDRKYLVFLSQHGLLTTNYHLSL